jgi:hypothetical protein
MRPPCRIFKRWRPNAGREGTLLTHHTGMSENAESTLRLSFLVRSGKDGRGWRRIGTKNISYRTSSQNRRVTRSFVNTSGRRSPAMFRGASDDFMASICCLKHVPDALGVPTNSATTDLFSSGVTLTRRACAQHLSIASINSELRYPSNLT